MLKLLAYPIYVVLFLPSWLWTRLTGWGHYGSRYRRAGSFWEMPVKSAPARRGGGGGGRWPLWF